MNHAAPANAAAQPKPIRFVTNHDGPYAKRRRINSACLTCRRKKTRCSGERPVCNTCVQAKHECAGYGDDNHGSSSTTSTNHTSNEAKDRKPVRRESTTVATPAPPPKVEPPAAPPIDPQLTRPRLVHTHSTFSHASDSTPGHVFRGSEDGGSSVAALSLSTRNRMPYFRYFGPTAILPGLRQMVVKVRERQHGSAQTNSDQNAIESSPAQPFGSPQVPEARTPIEIPVYDASPMSPSPLITHLCKLFFIHLACSFPFLQRERFMRDLEEKQVDAILVDAVCALAARFSSHPMMTGTNDQPKEGETVKVKIPPSDYGQAFAQRAKSAIPDAFPCPSMAVVQAALLLAYDEFGASRDSGLWMYLGIAIRMAQDLGLQTLEGLKYEGRSGPTPHSIKSGPERVRSSSARSQTNKKEENANEEQEQRAAERERLDTFWSIFLLDRVISSGTGRPVTLRDRDIDIAFPSLDEVDPSSGWPQPFPALIRIIHLYGRVTDLINRIRDTSDINDDLQKQLGSLEDRLTLIYQNLSPRLHFNAVNFQQYVKFNQGTNFLLMHVWFHALIVLLHQPTLLKPFEGSPQSLYTNSRELSMSSAKTIADILSFTELIDAKTGLGNPFTSQPIYIAACAFLNETAIHSASSQPHSRPSTPGSNSSKHKEPADTSIDHFAFAKATSAAASRTSEKEQKEQKQAAKHSLLASAANQNYQRCYRALKAQEPYWAGVKYIMTVLDQKAVGVAEPLLYTREEMESALEEPRTEPSFTSPGWRRKLSWGTYLTAQSPDPDVAKMAAALRKGAKTPTIPGSPMVHPSQAIGWSLTGTMNSPSTNVAVMYSSENSHSRDPKAVPVKPPPASTQPSIASLISDPPIKYEVGQQVQTPAAPPQFDPTSMPPPPVQSYNVPTPDPVMVSDADLLLNLHSPFAGASPAASRNSLAMTSYARAASIPNAQQPPQSDFSPPFVNYGTPTDNTFGDMVIDAQDIDMSLLGPDMMPWDLEYLPHDLLYLGNDSFGNNGIGEGGAVPPES